MEAQQTATVVYVGDGQTQEASDAYGQRLAAELRAGVEAVAMDLWAPYWQSTVGHVPEADGKIAHDPYHLRRVLSDAVDTVGKTEHRRLAVDGDQRLTGTKHLWLFGRENVAPVHQERFDELRGQRLKTSRAWAIKEMFRDFWTSPTVEEGLLGTPAPTAQTPLVGSARRRRAAVGWP